MRVAEEVPFTQWLKTQQLVGNVEPASTGATIVIETEDPPVAKNTRERSASRDGSRLCQFCLLLLAALIVLTIILGAIRPPDPNDDRVAQTLSFRGTLTTVVIHGHPLPPPLPPSPPPLPLPPPPSPSPPPFLRLWGILVCVAVSLLMSPVAWKS